MAGYLMDGYGVKTDFDLAIRYYRRAADLAVRMRSTSSAPS